MPDILARDDFTRLHSRDILARNDFARPLSGTKDSQSFTFTFISEDANSPKLRNHIRIKSGNLVANMMLYIGPLVDLWPVKRYAYAHKDFIYVDGLPNSRYFQPDQPGWQLSKDKETMVSKIRDDLQSDEALLSDNALPYDAHTFRLRGGATLTYYFNRKDLDIPNDPHLKEILPQVTAIYIHGFSPVLPPLPLLKHYYYTELSNEVELPETVSMTIVPEIDQDDDNFCYETMCPSCDHIIEL